MNIEKSTQTLQEQLDLIPLLLAKNAASSEFKKWYRAITNTLERIPKKGVDYYERFKFVCFRDAVLSDPPHRPLNNEKCYQEGMNLTKDILEAIIEEMKEYPDDFIEGEQNKQQGISIIENICNKFCLLATSLSKTHHASQRIVPIIIQNEYDVQYIFQSILSLFYDDVRPEEPGGKRAGSGSKADFWIPQENTIIECKYIKPDLTREKLKGQIDKDSRDYQTRKDWKTIIFFIYDPQRLLAHPRGFENDFNSLKIGSATIKVFIRPTGN